LLSVSAPVQISLVCEELSWVEIRRNNKTTRRLDVRTLKETSTMLDARRAIVTRGMASIPVDIEVPTGFPECHLNDRGDGIRWMLHVSTTRKDGTPFSCAFEVPVYERRAIGTSAIKTSTFLSR
jgi:hypothetical protein